MHLAAIYFEDASFLGKKILVNFGGSYNYIVEDEKVEINPKKQSLSNFYSGSPLEMISAIAGKNGAGKTTILKELAFALSMPDYPYKDKSSFTAFFEDGDKILFIGNPKFIAATTHIIDNRIVNTDTIYYSPHLDFYNDKPGIDISIDKWLYDDLENYSQYLLEYSGRSIFRYLFNQNIKRQIEFIASPKSKIISKEFNLPSYNQIRLTLPSIKVSKIDGKKIDYHNTPYNFQDIFDSILNKIDSEHASIGKRPDRAEISGQKDYMKNYLLSNFIYLLINKLEESNFALDEGYLPEKNDKESISALDYIYYFLDEHYFQKEDTKWDISLPRRSGKELLRMIIKAIDECPEKEEYWDWDDRSFVVDDSTALRLIEIQEKFLNDLDSYSMSEYDLGKDKINASYNPYKGLVSFEPSDRKLSSGEQSLLNLYSRLHAFLNDNFNKTQTRAKAELYLILLDEADLGFHPEWKKRYVKSINTFFKEYFKSFGAKCQIILSTHSPYSLSDLLSENVALCSYNEKDGFKPVNHSDLKTFSANIHELLAHSFFLEGGTIGDFAKDKLESLIKFLKRDRQHEDKYWTEGIARALIDQVGDPIISTRLNDLFREKYNSGMSLEDEERLLRARLDEIERLRRK